MKGERLMKSLDLNDVRNIGLNTLDYFAEICSNYNLTYYLGYGTLLGAVRHGGFIPWDDDIDVWMPRKDFEELIKLSSVIQNDKYELKYIDIEKSFSFLFAKLSRKDTVLLPSRFVNNTLYGCSIDVFPLDFFGNGLSYHQAIIQHNEQRSSFQKQINHYHAYTDGKDIPTIKLLAKRIAYGLQSCISGPFYKKFVDYIGLYSHNEISDYYVIMGYTAVFKKEWFSTTKLMEFENKQYYVPYDYDSILTAIYGDYMKLPPKEEQIVPHSFKAYYL